jgi:hypothetical protein
MCSQLTALNSRLGCVMPAGFPTSIALTVQLFGLNPRLHHVFYPRRNGKLSMLSPKKSTSLVCVYRLQPSPPIFTPFKTPLGVFT